ncbi:MFS general substrate transporter [Xylaria bambusicola]|uniref:MFS general substrate transporter n=1 Tax=Xylaria bambusicola TaxID=326684 RepID=UPI002008CAD5|nr:MFS general substrate transporter [Xylaria bambusicola]KAI0523868.1 MFS general substrate transporter [Xylaria bambusicola]
MDKENEPVASEQMKSISRQQDVEEKSFDDDNPAVSTEELYTVFTKWEKRWINLQSSFAAMFSTLSSYIYFPALVPMARDLHVSVALINLTVTSYLIVAAVAPAFMGDLADQGGRRPVYMIMFIFMLGANVGMALQTSYPALLVLRTLQSAGASGLIGAAYGVVADITQKEERGGFVGVLLLLTDIAPSLGPVIGGSLTQTLGWRWIFWFLAILQGTHMLVIALFMPETQRNIVGNGSGRCRGIYWSILYMLQSPSVKKSRVDMKKPRRHYPNPLACLPILRNKDSLTVVVMYAITYAVKLTLQTSLGAQALEIYQLDYLAGGLIYLPSGVAGGIGSYMTGRFLDRNYQKTKDQFLNNNNSETPGRLSNARLIRIRLKGLYLLVIVTAAGTIGYGWALATRAHISIMLILQFLTGMTTASTFTMTSTLLTDLNADRSATAQGASSIVRCLLAAAATATVEPLAEAVGLGWCFVVYAFIVLVNLPLSWGLQYYGDRQ